MSSRLIRNSMLAILILCIIGFSAFLINSRNKQKITVHHINISQLPTTGNTQAPLHIVAFEDLKCSNCMRFNTTLLPKIKKYFIDNNKASYSVATLAFLPGSPSAANAAYCIKAQHPQAFFDFTHNIYANQPPENENWATIPNLMLFASNIKNINHDKLAQCMVNNTYIEAASNNMQLANKTMGANNIATPSVYINGIAVVPLTWENFKVVAKQALAL